MRRFLPKISSTGSSAITRTSNYHLRRSRKWPLSPYKANWQETFHQQAAMEALKRSATASNHLLPALINSFNLYQCDPTPNAYHFIITTLTQAHQFPQLDQVLHRLQTVENFETPEYILIDLIDIYGNADMIQHAIDLFFRIPSFRCTPSVHSLNSLLSILVKNRQFIRIVPQILLKSQWLNIRIEESTCKILIKALCRIGKVSDAIKLLGYMIDDDGCVIDGRISSMIVSSLCDRRDLSAVEFMSCWEELKRLGFCPSSEDWGNLIRFLVKKGKGNDALNALEQMKMDRIKPDVVCYTMVLQGIIAEGIYKEVDKVFDEMLVLGVVPDNYTYNVYIHGLCQQNKLEEGIKMLACMEGVGCIPDLITYNTLLDGLCKIGEMSKMRGLVKEMKWKGIQLNSRSYKIFIDGLIKEGEIDQVLVLFKEMWDKGLIPQSSTVDEIICGLCQRGSIDDALKLLKDTLSKHVAPGIRAWDAMLSASGLNSCSENTLMDLTDTVKTVH